MSRHTRAWPLLAGLLLTRCATADPQCPQILPPTGGWAVDMCPTDPQVPASMEVVVDGSSRGSAAMVRVYHWTDDRSRMPQVAVLYASGFVRLKQNADPDPPIPFGSSFVLGPAYWPGPDDYHHSPQLDRLELDTTGLPTGPLRLEAQGSNHDFAVSYRLTMPPPNDLQTRLHVEQTHTATGAVTVDPTRWNERQGFKVVQVSSMFVSEQGPCDGGHTGCHDSDGARFLAADGARTEVRFSDLVPSSFLLATPEALGGTWLDALHRDDTGWQGNTPNVRVALDLLPATTTVTPQGFITATTAPNADNVGLWLHDDDPGSASWTLGESRTIGYWLLARDDPPDPPADLDLRPGLSFLDMEGGETCRFVRDLGQPTGGSVLPVEGPSDRALELRYDLGSASGSWAQVRCDFDPPLDLSTFDHLRFEWRGAPAAANSVEVALITRTGGEDTIFGRGFHHCTQRGWWGPMVVPFRFLHPWTPGTTLEPAAVTAFLVSVVNDPADDDGGAGALALDNVGAFNVADRAIPSGFETVPASPTAAAAAAGWIAGQQQPTGLVRSWLEEPTCVSHVYDQALALLVMTRETRWGDADAIVGALAEIQNPDGSWFKAYDCATLVPVTDNRWEGDVAWAVLALNRYVALGGTHPQAGMTRDAAAAWLETTVDTDQCRLVDNDADHTEAMIDLWWALATSPAAYQFAALALQHCLLEAYWDPEMGRFKGGHDWWQPYLDNQTWGAAFLRASCRPHDGRRALSYARDVLRLPSQGGQLLGLDGQAGPWSVWNEGVGQYASSGGEGAARLVTELLAQQRGDGAMPSSPDDFSGGGVWTTRWHGVAPTAWLYLALTGSPFPQDLHSCAPRRVDGRLGPTPP